MYVVKTLSLIWKKEAYDLESDKNSFESCFLFHPTLFPWEVKIH
jgi:hypothetical protein